MLTFCTHYQHIGGSGFTAFSLLHPPNAVNLERFMVIREAFNVALDLDVRKPFFFSPF